MLVSFVRRAMVERSSGGRRLVGIVASTILLLTAVACSRPETEAGGRAGSEPTAPNIVLIMTDDQTLEAMRVLSRTNELIGASGVSFERYFASFPLCCPARATFLTGQYSHNHGVRSNAPPAGGYASMTREEATVPVALQDVGYRTIFIGKYLNGYGVDDPTEIPPGWDEWHAGIDPSSYNYSNYRMNHNGTERAYGEDQASYTTDVATQLGVDEIEAAVEADRPFFLWMAYLAPHNAYADSSSFGTRVGADGLTRPAGVPAPVPAVRHRGAYADEPLPASPSFGEPDDADKPSWVSSRPPFDAEEQTGIEANYRAELESLLAVDEGVDRLIEALEGAGVLEDTYVIFTSDNGYFHGEHGLSYGKLLPYEESIHVPLLIRGPGVAKGATTSAMASDVDLPATVIDIAGARAPRVLDGRSLVPVLQEPATSTERELLLEAGPSGFKTPPYTGVRTAWYAYVEYSDGFKELYDLRIDPAQLDNRAGASDLAEVEATLAAAVQRLRSCRGEACW